MIKLDKEKIINFIALIKNKARKVRFHKTKEFKIFLMVIFILIVLCFLLPVFFDNSKLRNNISERLSKLTNAKVDIKGEVSVALLPSPRISINHLFVENFNPSKNPKENDKFYNFYSQNLEIIFPIFGWFEKKIIKKIILNNANIDVYKANSVGKLQKSIFYTKLDYFNKINPRSPPSKEGISSSIFAIEDLEAVAKFESLMPDLQINNGKVIHYDDAKIYSEFINIDATLNYQKNKILGYGNFVSDKIDNSFEMQFIFNKPKKNNASFFAIKSAVLDFRLTGTFFEENNDGVFKTKFRGNFNGYVMELKNFYKSLFSSSDITSQKLKTNGLPINFTGEIYNDGNEINIANIFVESTLLRGVGNIKIDKTAKILTSDIKFDFEKLDIDSIWNTQNPAKRIAELAKGINIDKNIKESVENSQKTNDLEPSQSDIIVNKDEIKIEEKNIENSKIFLNIREYDVNLDITAQKANLYEGEISDLKFNANISNDDKMSVFPLSFKLPSNSEVRIIGNFDQKKHKNRFMGSLDANGDSLYEIMEWLDINPKSVKINNLQKFNLFSNIEISDNDFIFNNFYLNLNDKKTEIYGDIEIKDIKVKRLITSDLKFSEFEYQKYISIPLNNPYFNEGIFADKILWLNQIFSNYNLKFYFDKLIYDDEIFENQEIKINFGPGYIKIPNNKFKSQNNNFDLSFSVEVADKKQQFDLELKAEKLKIDFQKDYMHEEIPVTKTIFDRFFQMPSLQGFDGKIELLAKDLTIGKIKINNFKYLIPVSNLTSPAKLEMDIFDGKFEFKGVNDLKYNKIINGNFTCKSCNINKIFQGFYGIENWGGIANISGNIVGVGKSVYEFKNKLISEISLAISAPSVKGYGLNEFIKKIYDRKKTAEDIKNPEEILHNKEGYTQFMQGKGFINLKGEKNSNFSISLKSTGVNSVFSGIIFMNEESINGTINTIFLAPNNQKQIPINIATNVTGYIDDVALVSNINQARQYLGLEKIEKTELDNILLAKTAEKKQAKKEKIFNKTKKIENKAKKINAEITENSQQGEEEVTTEIIEETQIIEINKPAEISKESDFVIIDKTQNDDNKDSKNSLMTDQNPIIDNAITSPNNSNQTTPIQSNPASKAFETENINIVEPSI